MEKIKCPKCFEPMTQSEKEHYGMCFDCELDAFERGEREPQSSEE